MTDKDLQAWIDQLKAENARVRRQPDQVLSMKVSQKGALSVHGLDRCPVTLYKEQWTRLLAAADDIRAFLNDNDAQLKSKGTSGGSA
jgi:hypothetical protein